MLEPITTFSLVTHEGPYTDWPLETPLLADGVPTGTSIAGFVIDGQYRCDEGFLLITSWDCLFEESYEFLLLSSNLRQLDRVSLGAPYSTYLLHAQWAIDERSVRLHFQTALFYTLSIRSPSLFRRRPNLSLTEHLVAPTDERSIASVAALHRSLASIRAKLEQGTDNATP
jgi:hypothetical protein